MRQIEIIAVGKLKENYLKDAEQFFRQEISKKVMIKIIAVPDEKTKDGAGIKEITRVKEKEGQKILPYLDAKAMIMVMDLQGKEVKSVAFQKAINDTFFDGQKLQIIIGGSLGLSLEVLEKAKMKIAFSKMTYPHQLFRIMVLEELNQSLT